MLLPVKSKSLYLPVSSLQQFLYENSISSVAFSKPSDKYIVIVKQIKDKND